MYVIWIFSRRIWDFYNMFRHFKYDSKHFVNFWAELNFLGNWGVGFHGDFEKEWYSCYNGKIMGHFVKSFKIITRNRWWKGIFLQNRSFLFSVGQRKWQKIIIEILPPPLPITRWSESPFMYTRDLWLSLVLRRSLILFSWLARFWWQPIRPWPAEG